MSSNTAFLDSRIRLYTHDSSCRRNEAPSHVIGSDGCRVVAFALRCVLVVVVVPATVPAAAATTPMWWHYSVVVVDLRGTIRNTPTVPDYLSSVRPRGVR